MKENRNDNDDDKNENVSNEIIDINWKINEDNNNYINTFLNKKRKIEKAEEEFIENLKKLIEKSRIDKNILKKKLFPDDENENIKEIKKKENKENNENINITEITENKRILIQEFSEINLSFIKRSEYLWEHINLGEFKNINNSNKIIEINDRVNHIQQTNSLYDWYKKLNFLPNLPSDLSIPAKDKNISINKNVIIFNGSKNSLNKYPHYIYSHEKLSFDGFSKNKKISWKIKFKSESNLIGIGIINQNLISSKTNNFLSDDINFNNGVFALIQTFNPDIKKYCIRPWNCLDKNLVNHVAEFPYFRKGKTINISYYTTEEILEFKIKNNVYNMKGVKSNKKMNPCIIFYYPNDEVEFSEIEINDKY